MECYFCRQHKEIDFRDTDLLKKFLSGLFKIRGRKKTGLCARHQRELARAIKRARYMALLPYVPK